VKVIILAAGQGTRLRPLTDDRPKCLVEFCGQTLLERQVNVHRQLGLTDIHILSGYRSDQIEERGLATLINPDYATTNMVATLFCGASLMTGEEDVVISYGDIVFEPPVLEKLLASDSPLSIVSDQEWERFWSLRMENPLDDAETFKTDADGRVVELGLKPTSRHEVQGQYIGLIKVRADVVKRFVEEGEKLKDEGEEVRGRDFASMYMTDFLQHLIDVGLEAKAVPIENGWLEVDTVEDLRHYEKMASVGKLDQFFKG